MYRTIKILLILFRLRSIRKNIDVSESFGFSGSFGRMDFRRNSDISFFLITDNGKNNCLERSLKSVFPADKTTLHYFPLAQSEKHTLNSDLSAVLLLSETIPIYNKKIYWQAYESKRKHLKSCLSLEDLIQYKIGQSVPTIKKIDRILQLLPLQIVTAKRISQYGIDGRFIAWMSFLSKYQLVCAYHQCKQLLRKIHAKLQIR
jgi:hypothetical protein